MSVIVSTAQQDGVRVITLDNPPVNALSHRLREPLYAALEAARDDVSVASVVLICAGRTFISGADISEFGTPNAFAEPNLPQLCALLESMGKPVVAAIHGSGLGGGLEVALSCHCRIATSDAKLGLPEVKLGLIPGCGGTVRLPRLVGAEAALDIIASGKPVSASRAASLGLLDAIATGDLLADAIAFADAKGREGNIHLAVRDRDERLAETRSAPQAFEKLAQAVEKKARGLDAPRAIVQALRNAIDLPFDEALQKEREAFLTLLAGNQSRAQRHLFFAEREVAKVEGVDKDTPVRKVEKIGVIGAGTMGGGIAMAFANGGYAVTILDTSDEALDRGFGVIERNYAASVARGSLSDADKAARLGRLSRATDYRALGDCDVIVEAVFEEMSVKQAVFEQLDAVAKPGAILATNTSYLDVNEIAAFTKRPQDVLGLHFFSPAHVMKLLEIVRARETSPEVLATALAVARRIGKIAVTVGVCFGFVGNRMNTARGDDIESLLLDGASPEQVDRVLTEFGFPMGPLAMLDLAGLDIGLRKRRALGQRAIIADTLAEEGRLGQKTGRGFYLYPEGSRTPQPDPDVAKLIADAAAERSIVRRAISDEEIIERTLYPLVNEGARILEEGIAARASDIDVVWVNGYGFPVGKGGPMHWADTQSLAKIVERLDHWHRKTGRAVYAPAELLRDLAGKGASFTART